MLSLLIQATAVILAFLTAAIESFASTAPTDHLRTIIGWEGDRNATNVYLNGSFTLRLPATSKSSPDEKTLHFKVTEGISSFEWKMDEGYLPAFVSTFRIHKGPQRLRVSIRSFADRVEIKQREFVIDYFRVVVKNLSEQASEFDPGAPAELIPLSEREDPGNSRWIPAGETHYFDFAIAADRFDNSYPMPTASEVAAAGNWDAHYQHMKQYWNRRLEEIATPVTPDKELDLSYKAGFIYTMIVKDGNDLKPGEFTYDYVYDHDAIGILATLLTQGDLSEAKALLAALPLRLYEDGTRRGFDDAKWKFAWPFAIYVQKTGDLDPIITRWKEIYRAAHDISARRLGPGNTMAVTGALDVQGSWTVDNWSALTGLQAYRYLAEALGNENEELWAAQEYQDLLRSVNSVLGKTMKENGYDFIPCFMSHPELSPNCIDPTDANWASQFLFGRWAWDGWLLGAGDAGPGGRNLPAAIDATYSHGFRGLQIAGYPLHSFGGFHTAATGYNAGYAAAALRGDQYRTEGIRAYEYMLKDLQSGPNAWWESMNYSQAALHWSDGKRHPTEGVGDCPHIWAQALASKVFLDSLAAEFFDGKLLLGRGIPTDWLMSGRPVEIRNFPISIWGRITVHFQTKRENVIELRLTGDFPRNEIWVDLPIFLNSKKIEASTGRFDQMNSRLVLPRETRRVEIKITP